MSIEESPRSDGLKRVLRGRDELGIIYQYIIDRANYVSVKETSGQKEKFDWEYLVRILRYHGVFPLFYRAFSTTPEGNVDDVRDHLRSHYYSIVMRNQLLCSELVRILGLFKAESIEVISFKGPTLAALAYGSISQRQFADIDLLVHFEDLEAVRQIMEAEAYWPYFRAYRRPIVRLTKAQKRSYLRNYHEYEFRREDGMQVDLHWHTAPRQFPFRLDPERLWSDLQIVSLEEGDVSTFSSENLLLYLCVHGAKEQWRRLAWVIDLDRLLRTNGDMNWDIILREARNAHAMRALAFGLGLANTLFDTTISREVTHTLGFDFTLTPQAACELLFDQSPRCGPLSRVPFALCETARDKTLYVGRSLTSSTPPDWSRIPLPDSLFWMYRGLKPLLIGARCVLASLRKVRTWIKSLTVSL